MFLTMDAFKPEEIIFPRLFMIGKLLKKFLRKMYGFVVFFATCFFVYSKILLIWHGQLSVLGEILQQ